MCLLACTDGSFRGKEKGNKSYHWVDCKDIWDESHQALLESQCHCAIEVDIGTHSVVVPVFLTAMQVNSLKNTGDLKPSHRFSDFNFL